MRSRAKQLAFILAFLPLPSCATGAPELQPTQLGAELHAVPRGDTPSTLLSACGGGFGEYGRYISDVQTGVNSWFEVVRTIDQCNIDTARYYTSSESLSRIMRPLDSLAQAGAPQCRQEAAALRENVLAANTEIVTLVGTLSSLCQTTDSLTDIQLQKSRLRQRRTDVCQRLSRTLGGNESNRC